MEQLKMDCEHFRARLETAQADCMKEKKVDFCQSIGICML